MDYWSLTSVWLGFSVYLVNSGRYNQLTDNVQWLTAGCWAQWGSCQPGTRLARFFFFFWLLCSLKTKVLRIAKIWSGHFINLFPLSQSGRTACLWSIWPSHLMFIEGLAAICASCPSWCGMRRDLEQSSVAQDKSRLKKGIWFAKHFTRSKF